MSGASALAASIPIPSRSTQPALGLQGRAKWTAQLRSLLGLGSRDAISHRNEAMASRLRDRLARETWDAVVVEFTQMTVNLVGLPRGVPCVVDEHNVEYDLQRRSAASSSNPLRRTFLEANRRKLRREEISVWRGFDGVSVTSPRDLAIVQAHAPQARCVLSPNGVDLGEFAPPPGAPEPDTVIFFGAHNYFPNADGLRFFFAEIWPLVLAARPSARLRVVGPLPPPDIVALQPHNADVRGLRHGTSSPRLDARQSLSHRCGSAVERAEDRRGDGAGAARGSNVHWRRGHRSAARPRPINCRCAARLRRRGTAPAREAAEATALGLRGRRLVEKAYGWDASAAQLERLLEELVGQQPRSR